MTDYTDLGYDDIIKAQNKTNSTNQSLPYVTKPEFDSSYEGVPGQKVQGGTTSSVDGRLNFNLEEGYISSETGVGQVLRLGKQADGSYGLLISDEQGNPLLNVTGDNNFIQSPDGKIKLDLLNKIFTIDEGSFFLNRSDKQTIIDQTGLVSNTNFPTQTARQSGSQTVTAPLATPDAVGGGKLTITTIKRTSVLVLLSVLAYIEAQTPGNFSGGGIVGIRVDDQLKQSLVVSGLDNGTDTYGVAIASYTTYCIADLNPGNHVIDLIAWINQLGFGNAQLVINSYRFSYLILGN
jgi:hypothetical protein